MCVICHKRKEDRLPTAEEIRAMWERNPDGAGAMWRLPNGKVEFAKGFMKLNAFETWFEKSRETLADAEAAFHFRITTHGGTNAGNCHPFIADGKSDPHILTGRAENVLMHNGIISVMGNGRKDAPDSAELARYVGQTKDAAGALEYLKPFIECGNRILMFAPKGRTVKYGYWSESNGLSFSNLNHDTKLGFSGFGSVVGIYSGRKSCPSSSSAWDEYDDFVADYMNSCLDGTEEAVLMDGKFVSVDSGLPVNLSEVDVSLLSDAEYRQWEDMVGEEADYEFWYENIEEMKGDAK